MKQVEESFSELFLRIGNKTSTVRELAGALGQDQENARAFQERIALKRIESNKNATKRMNDVHTRFKRIH